MVTWLFHLILSKVGQACAMLAEKVEPVYASQLYVYNRSRTEDWVSTADRFNLDTVADRHCGWSI